MAADKFRRIFNRVQYSWVLGLTATLERLDGKHDVISRVAPVCDVITQKEAIQKGWIADFIEFNLAVPITAKEARIQVNLGKQIRYYMSKFGDFYDMLSCMGKKNATNYANKHNLDPNEVIKWATQGIRLIHKRKEFLDTTEHKINAAVELIEEFNVRTITFSQSTTFANEIAKRLGKKCKVYHSTMESEMRQVKKDKTYKTEKGARNYYNSLVELGYKPKFKTLKKGYVVEWKELKSFSGNAIANENVKSFIEGKTLILASAKALDQGFDVPDVLLGVDGSRSENPTQHTQRTGRVARNYTFEDGRKATKVYVNLYVPDWSVQDSRDERKLRQCQRKNAENVIWVDDLEELKNNLKNILKKRGKTKGSTKNSFVSITESADCVDDN
jgi:superfamily II DNA or RNA helicase